MMFLSFSLLVVGWLLFVVYFLVLFLLFGFLVSFHLPGEFL